METRPSFVITHAGERPRSPIGDPSTGATLVEYVLGAALVALAVLGGIGFLQGAARDGLEDRAASAGAPDLGPGVPVPPTTAAPTTAAPSDPGTTAPPTLTPVATLSASARKDGADWVATVVVQVTDPATGDPVPQASVSAQWSAGYTAATSCVTSERGTCPVSSAEIDRTGGSAVPSVVLTVTDISGAGITYTQAPPSITVAAAR